MANRFNFRDYVILYFPATFRNHKFGGFPTRILCPDKPLEPGKLIKLYMEEAGWVACYVVAFFDSQEELARNFLKEIENFRRYFEIVPNASRYFALFFPHGICGKTLEHFNTKGCAPYEMFSKWLEVYDPFYGWRQCFVFYIFDSQEEIRRNFNKLLENFSRFTEHVSSLDDHVEEKENKNTIKATIVKTEHEEKPNLDLYHPCNEVLKKENIPMKVKREHLPSTSSIASSEEDMMDKAQNIHIILDDDDGDYTSPEEEKILKRHSDRYSLAIRQLLKLHFTPEVLMTHSLTGQASPAFVNRQYKAKPLLDETIVSHITRLIMKNFRGLSRTTIRRIMTTTLADAKKLKANKQKTGSVCGEE